jgi:hypothetical protein
MSSSGSIKVSEYLSTRALNVFKRIFKDDKTNLVKYYNKNKHFLEIDHCGKKSNKELIQLSKLILSDREHSSVNTINNVDFFKGGPKLSKRASNIFIKKFEKSEEKLVSFFEKNGHFLNVRNCGSKTSNELVDYAKSIINKKLIIDEESIQKYYDQSKNLESKERHFLDCYIKFLCEKNEITELSFKELIFEKSQSSDKIEQIKFYILHYLNSLRKGNSVNQYALNLILNRFELTNNAQDYIVDNKLHLLKLFKDVSKSIFNNTELYILQYYLNYSLNKRKHETLKSTGKALDLSSERIRQISNEIIKSFREKFFQFHLLQPLVDLNEYYGSESHIITLDNELVISLNKTQKTNYNHLLINKLFEIIFYDKYSLLGDENNYHSVQRHRKNLNFSWSYLFSKQIKGDLHLKKFFLRIEELIEKNHSSTHEYSLKYLLFDFSKSNSLLKMKEYYSPIKNVLRREFDIIISRDNKFKIRRNTKRKNYEYALEILEEMEPSKQGYDIDVIVGKILDKFGVNFFKKKESLRSAINNSNQFIYFGRSSHYGLKKWEVEFNGIKGGTIKEIVKEYVSKHSQPKHIGEIAKEVKKYRETTSEHIHTNLKLDPHDNFIFFHGGYIGLKNKNYEGFKTIKVNPRIFVVDNLSNFLPAPFTQFINKFSNEYEVRKPRLEYIVKNKIKKKELLLDGNILKIRNDKSTKSEYDEGVNRSVSQDKSSGININKELVNKMVQWDTKNHVLTTKQQQYLAYFAYGIKELTDYHKKNIKSIMKILRDHGF